MPFSDAQHEPLPELADYVMCFHVVRAWVLAFSTSYPLVFWLVSSADAYFS